MLLMTLDINGTTRRVSNDEISLDHSWFAEVAAAPQVKRASSKLHGGIFAPSFGGFTLTHETFVETTWRPLDKIAVDVKWTDTTEAEAVSFLSGTGYLSSFDRESIVYNLLKPDYDVAINGSITGNLTDIFTTYCGASYLNRTLDTSGTSRNPAVSYSVTSDTQVVDILSSIAAFFSHAFYDDGTTIYLYDCLTDNGTLSLTEFDFLPVTYQGGYAASEFVAGDYSVSGSSPLGSSYSVSPVCHTDQTNIEAALADIKTIMEMPGARIALPMDATATGIKPGMKISWLDESQGEPVTAWIRVQSITYDIDNYEVAIEGSGGITA